MSSDQIKLDIDNRTSSDLAKEIFWKYANRRAQKELKESYLVDDENVDAVKAFVAYFTGNLTTMEEYGIDPRKGILLIGNPGSGKSMLFRILRDCLTSDKLIQLGEREVPERAFFKRFTFLTCEHMAKLYMAEGEKMLTQFGRMSVVKVNGEYICRHACFDDLGAEEIRNNFGNKKEVMVDLINERYDNFIDHGLLTHFTTNLKPEEIEARYSTRIRSRLKHMCNVIELGTSSDSKDRR